MNRSCFASFPVCVYKFSSHYLNNIIFIDNRLGPLATESPCIIDKNLTRNEFTQHGLHMNSSGKEKITKIIVHNETNPLKR